MWKDIRYNRILFLSLNKTGLCLTGDRAWRAGWYGIFLQPACCRPLIVFGNRRTLAEDTPKYYMIVAFELHIKIDIIPLFRFVKSDSISSRFSNSTCRCDCIIPYVYPFLLFTSLFVRRFEMSICDKAGKIFFDFFKAISLSI